MTSPEAVTMPEEVRKAIDAILNVASQRYVNDSDDDTLVSSAGVLSAHITAQAKRIEEAEAAAKYEAQRGADQMTRRLKAESSLASAEATIARLQEALGRIAEQKLLEELEPDERDDADVEAGYRSCVMHGRIALSQTDDGDWVRVPKVAIDWLMGETPDHKGRWFMPEENARGAYWWRSRFTEICTDLAARPSVPPVRAATD